MKGKDCFGILDEVFPMGDEGLRAVVPECFECSDRVECLKAALSTTEGLEMREEIMDRRPVSGLIERLKRWSEKKELSHMIKEEKKRK
ncbi:MAG: hypothetical protein MUO52_16670 [Desulfobacterales bacterium]|nr:hypothetical protein [Desulfobacterales bacterium]